MDINALATKLTYGLHIVSVADSARQRPAGFVLDAVCQLSMGEEPLVVVSVMNKNYSKDCIAREGLFNLSILPADVDPFVIANFGFQTSKEVEKWANVDFSINAGLPVLSSAVSWAQLRVTDSRILDTHTAFFCVPTETGYLHPDKEPLRYADYFTKLKEPAFAAFKVYKDKQAGKETT